MMAMHPDLAEVFTSHDVVENPSEFPVKLRKSLGMFATGVAVVTTRTLSGEPIGLTISSFSSLSLSPPLVLWSLDRKSSCRKHFTAAQHYAVNILTKNQLDIARQFAGPSADRWKNINYENLISQPPIIKDCAAVFKCSSRHLYPGGDHILFVGHVDYCMHLIHSTPLIFHNGMLT